MPQQHDPSSPRAPFVDFKALRRHLSFAEVLKHYGVSLRIQQKGHRHVGVCPLPTHQGAKKNRSFSAKLDWGVWQCFSCKASGNVLDFAVRMEGLNPTNPQHFRSVALKLQERFGAPSGTPVPARPRPVPSPKPSKTVQPLPVIVNPPLDFELKNLDYDHPYLLNRGFTPETIRYFGLGYCNRGLMKGRIVIPLHNEHGQLVGYAGRVVDDSQISETNPKYKFPATREHNGQVLTFDPQRLVYNAHRIARPATSVVVVQGFPPVWWVTQARRALVISLMGASCSDAQAKTISSCLVKDGRVLVLTDATDVGDRCAESVWARLANGFWVRRVSLDPGKQPTDDVKADVTTMLDHYVL